MDNVTDQKHIYVNQPFKIILDTATDLTNASVIQIRIVDPDGIVSLKTATIDGTIATAIDCNIAGSFNNKAGQWVYRAWVTFTGDANPVPGVPVIVLVENI